MFQQAARARPFWLATASGAALAACPVLAQTEANPAQPEEVVGEPDLQTPDVVPTTTDAPATQAEDQIGFAADNLNYDSDTEVVVAEGNVQMNREAIEMRSDKVTWNRKTGQVFAEGNVVIKNPEGDTAYGDKIELTDSLRDGVVENLLVVLDNGSRLAAIKGTRFDNGNIELENAAYTPCPVEDDEGCPKNPSWQVRAVRVLYDKAKNKVRYKGARIEIFGLPLIPLPGLSHSINNEPSSGLLVPEIRLDRSNGFEIAVPYYLRIAPDRDITITPHLYTSAAPMIEGEFRALT
ncbi:MAG TPA: LptA/OstA family protein, partial [Sphingopyxis sp.]|nr:LptA/OstA family protein [Sphingopyxis sp.]